MRRVTPEEAKATLKRLLEWAKSDSMPKGGKLGEWVFETSDKFESTGESLTKNVIQKKWNTPSLFPQCPESNINNPLKVYFDNLKEDEVFSTNKYGESVVMKRALSEDGKTLYVMTFNEKNFIKQFALATVTYEDGFYVHESKGSYFEEQGAEKYYTLEQGLEWTGGDKVFGDLSVQKFGGYGEYAVVKDKSIYHAPTNISTKESAGLPMSASTALIAIQKVAPNKSDNILVYGASGAVGYTLSQILIAKGYKVTLVASKKHHAYLSELNPVDILDYADPNFKLKDDSYNLIFAVNGYQPIKAYMKALKKRGKLAVIGGDFRQINDAMMKGLFYRVFKRKRALSIMSKSTPETLNPSFPHVGHVNQPSLYLIIRRILTLCVY